MSRSEAVRASAAALRGPASAAVVRARVAGDRVDDGEPWAGAVDLWIARGSRRRTARRGIAATMLARYVGIAPGELEFSRGAHGRPELRTRAAGREVWFSTSTAPDVFVLAVAATPVGVDVEPLTRRVATDGLIEAVCTPRERDRLSALALAARREAFIWCWTGKEACAKASGLGLGAPLESIDAGAGPGASVVQASSDGSLGPWTLFRVQALPGYALAIAVL